MGEVSKIIGKTSDKFFMRSEKEVKRSVANMNHATRFYLAFKFYRQNQLDFEPNANIETNFSKLKICQLLGIGRSLVHKFVSKMGSEVSIENVMKKKKNIYHPLSLNQCVTSIFF